MSIQVRPQWPLLRHDPWLLSSLSWIPIVLAFSIWWIFSQGIVRDLPIGVVDLSHSQLSRQLIRDFDATSTMAVTHQFQDVNQAKTALIESDIYAYVVIPYQFDKSIFRGEQPQVSTFFNSQYILVGRLINSAIVQAQSTFNAQVDVVKNLATSQQTTLSAMGRAVPIRTQITPLFNLNTNYAQFLVSAVIPALWQIVVVVSTIMILAANHRHFGLQTWLGEKPLRILTLTLMRYLPIFMLQGIWFFNLVLSNINVANARQFCSIDYRTTCNDARLYDHGRTLFLSNTRSGKSDEFCWRFYRTKFCVYGHYVPSDGYEYSSAVVAKPATSESLH